MDEGLKEGVTDPRGASGIDGSVLAKAFVRGGDRSGAAFKELGVTVGIE